MSFYAGLASTDPSELQAAGGDRLGSIARSHDGTGKPSLWQGDGAALVHVLRCFTPEDRFDRLPGRFAGGTSWLVFDGRFDNRDDLITALAIAPDRAASLGDGGLLMAALERWGTDACEKLIGVFSFAWWDDRTRRLVLAVDAIGGRALFVHTDADRLCFATRPMAVLAFPGVDRQIDEEAMAHLLLARPLPTGVTPFRGVFRLPPAGCLIWQDGRHSTHRYWQPDLTRQIRYRDPRDYTEAAREVLDRTVQASLRADGPIACQLSGGLDSPGVAATAARLMAPAPLHTLTAFPDPLAPLPSERAGRSYNETRLARATAARYANIEAHYLPAGGLARLEEDPGRVFWDFGLPLRNFPNFGAWQPMHDKAVDLGAKVLLTGFAGNYTLSWKSEALLADLAASGRLIALAGQFWGLHRNGQKLGPQFRQHLVRYLLPAGARRTQRRLRGLHDLWRPRASATAELAARVDADAIVDDLRIATDRPDRDRRRRLFFLERHWALSQWLAAYPYAFGCDMRDPLGDRRMVEFCLALPADLWQSGGQPRSFVRTVLRDRLPAEVLDAKERGIQTADWFHRLTLLRPQFMDELDRLEASPTARRLLDLPRIRAVAEDWPEDADAAMTRAGDMLDLFGRGIYYGKFIRWVEGANG